MKAHNKWTPMEVAKEVDDFGTLRIAAEHNKLVDRVVVLEAALEEMENVIKRVVSL